MYNDMRQIFGNTVDFDAVIAEAITIGGESPSVPLMLSLVVKQIAVKQQKQIDELKEQIFLNSPSLAELVEQNQANFGNVIDLGSTRNLKEADANLNQIVSAFGEMTEEQQQAFVRKEAQAAAEVDKTITLGVGINDMDSKNIYLRTRIGPGQIEQIIGLHAIGHAGPYPHTVVHEDGRREEKVGNFMALDTWGNEYDSEHNMLGRGSFRLHTHDIDQYAAELVSEGWEIYEGPNDPSTDDDEPESMYWDDNEDSEGYKEDGCPWIFSEYNLED